MKQFINHSFSIGTLTLPHRLIQGPLAGYSCAPFRELFSLYTAPAYCVSEMLSAHDVVNKHSIHHRYLYRSPNESNLCYQISGIDPLLMTEAAVKLEYLGAQLIDINCGCPKMKIRKKGAGSALLENPPLLLDIVSRIRKSIQCPLTVKIRLQSHEKDIPLCQSIVDAGADALIVHGRRWIDDYDIPCQLSQIAAIKQAVAIPVIANGDIQDSITLEKAFNDTGCDGFMVSRAGTGKPWIFQELLNGITLNIDVTKKVSFFIQHLKQLALLESEYQAVLQSKSLLHYYFFKDFTVDFKQKLYQLTRIEELEAALMILT